MKVWVYRILLFNVALNITMFGAHAQHLENEIFLRAMQDELNRSMTELRSPDVQPPFFIMYGATDQKNYTISGTLGSLHESLESINRFKTTTRVLVGDYSFNDESLEDNLFSSPTAVEIGLPMDDDYEGIRRAFWSTTDNVYRDASKHFEKHKRTLKESGKSLKELPHRTFARGKAIELVSSLQPGNFDVKSWEEKIRNLSAIFIDHPFVLNSAVGIRFIEGYKYLVNSEGVVAKIPESVATFFVFAQAKNDKGEFLLGQIIQLTKKPDQLPNEEELTQEINNLIVNLKDQLEIPNFDDEYRGPVLFLGSSVANLFSNALLTGRDRITENDNISKLSGFQYSNEMTSMANKIDKKVVDRSITIKAKPKLESFQGIELLGSFKIDDEGIVPPDELTIIDSGILKELLNNRTLTDSIQKANGFSSGPGVLEIKLQHKDSEEVLKKKLIDAARDEGLDYAIIVRDSPGLSFRPVNVYKVSLEDGSEQLVKNAILNQSGFRPINDILGASGIYQAANLSVGNGVGPNVFSNGGVVSFITPNAILVEEIECQPFRMPSLLEDTYVSNPLLKN